MAPALSAPVSAAAAKPAPARIGRCHRRVSLQNSLPSRRRPRAPLRRRTRRQALLPAALQARHANIDPPTASHLRHRLRYQVKGASKNWGTPRIIAELNNVGVAGLKRRRRKPSSFAPHRRKKHGRGRRRGGDLPPARPREAASRACERIEPARTSAAGHARRGGRRGREPRGTASRSPAAQDPPRARRGSARARAAPPRTGAACCSLNGEFDLADGSNAGALVKGDGRRPLEVRPDDDVEVDAAAAASAGRSARAASAPPQ